MKIPKTSTPTDQLPVSWTFKTWPPAVYPHSETKARHVCRQHQRALLSCGALTRPGAEIVIIAAGYARWLTLQANVYRVDNFDVPANREEHAHKRFGRGAPAVEA